MRICALTSTFLPKVGGHEAVVDQLTRQFNKTGNESVVLAQHLSVKGTPGKLDVPYRVVRFRKPFSQVWDIGVLQRALLRLQREWPFDIIHSHSSYPTGYSALRVGARLNIPVVITPHGSDIAETSRFQNRPVVMARIRETLERADAVTAISAYLKGRALLLAPECAEHLVEISNGIDCVAFAQIASRPERIKSYFQPEHSRYFLFLGRFHSRKGIDILIEAFACQARSDTTIHLVIGGDGPEREALHRQAAETGVANRIHFLGLVHGQEKLWLLQNALCLVVPTKSWEGLPIVVLEGLASGQAIVGSRVGGIVDLVKDGENGILIEPGNAQNLADALDAIAKNPESRQRMAEASREKATGYDWPQITARYLALFGDLIARKKSDRRESSIA